MTEEHLVVGPGKMMTREEVETAVKTDMTDVMIGHGAPEIITLWMITGEMIVVPLKDPN